MLTACCAARSSQQRRLVAGRLVAYGRSIMAEINVASTFRRELLGARAGEKRASVMQMNRDLFGDIVATRHGALFDALKLRCRRDAN